MACNQQDPGVLGTTLTSSWGVKIWMACAEEKCDYISLWQTRVSNWPQDYMACCEVGGPCTFCGSLCEPDPTTRQTVENIKGKIWGGGRNEAAKAVSIAFTASEPTRTRDSVTSEHRRWKSKVTKSTPLDILPSPSCGGIGFSSWNT